MESKPVTVHGVQLFALVKGRLTQGRFLECRGASEACQVAEERVRLGRAAGAAAFARTIIDKDYDDGDEPVTLAVFGRVPQGVADQLPF